MGEDGAWGMGHGGMGAWGWPTLYTSWLHHAMLRWSVPTHTPGMLVVELLTARSCGTKLLRSVWGDRTWPHRTARPIIHSTPDQGGQ